MKTTQEKIEDIRRVCIKANPEIVELKFGCVVYTTRMNYEGERYKVISYKKVGRVTLYDQLKVIKEGRNGVTTFGNVYNNEGISYQFEIIGRPIRLADVLFATRKQESIQAYTRAVSKLLFTNHKSEHFSSNQDKKEWSFSKNSLTEQSEETINFVHLLLCNK